MNKKFECNGAQYQVLAVKVESREAVLIRRLDVANCDFLIFVDEPDRAVWDVETLRKATIDGELIYKQD